MTSYHSDVNVSQLTRNVSTVGATVLQNRNGQSFDQHILAFFSPWDLSSFALSSAIFTRPPIYAMVTSSIDDSGLEITNEDTDTCSSTFDVHWQGGIRPPLSNEFTSLHLTCRFGCYMPLKFDASLIKHIVRVGSNTEFTVNAPDVLDLKDEIGCHVQLEDSIGDRGYYFFTFERDHSLCDDERDHSQTTQGPGPSITSLPASSENPISQTPSTNTAASDPSSDSTSLSFTATISSSSSRFTISPGTFHSVEPSLTNSLSNEPHSTTQSLTSPVSLDSNPQAAGRGKQSIGAIVGGSVVGAVVLTLSCVFCFVFVRRRRKFNGEYRARPFSVPELRGRQNSIIVTEQHSYEHTSIPSDRKHSLEFLPRNLTRGVAAHSERSSVGAVVMSDYSSQSPIVDPPSRSPRSARKFKDHIPPSIPRQLDNPTSHERLEDNIESPAVHRSRVVQSLQAQVQQLISENARLAELTMPPPAYQSSKKNK
ncbi:hypothetical protein VKT23_009361 [Stygiomarasmius scandens]|uniref:Uncharacterized protein n=1 Tax=Marasmiellus scandens TaxID=2682957 RepID=A0ABR1JF75_9AGAR